MGRSKFERVGDISPATLTGLREGGHGGLADLLAEMGTGYVADGFVRVVDPARISPHLGVLFEESGGAVPFATTALGDIVLSHQQGVDVAQLRTGQVLPFQPDPGGFLTAAESEVFRLVQLHAVAYLDLPRPALDRAYFATPLQAFGGSGAAETLREADVLATWLAAAGVIGRASLP